MSRRIYLPARSRFGRGRFRHLSKSCCKMPKQVRHDSGVLLNQF